MFKSLHLENFTAFKNATLKFSPNINVFIGENGSGKTHLMKLIYCLQHSGQDAEKLEEKLINVFRVKSVGRLVHRKIGVTNTEVILKEISSRNIKLQFDNSRAHKFELKENKKLIANEDSLPVFIPVKEVLSFAPGFISLYDKYNLSFEEIYYDIVKQAYLPPRKGMPLQDERPLLEHIRKTLGGKVKISGDEFQLASRGSNLEMSLVAEGHRKLALIWQLIHNGSLSSNNTLFWDEPEANLNPYLMKDVAKILVMLAERNVQVFVATHNYAFLKELEFEKNKIDVKYFALQKSDSDVIVNEACSYSDITPNKISEEYSRIYDQEVMRALGRTK